MRRTIRNAFTLAGLTLRLYSRDRRAFAMSLIFPLFFLFALGGLLGGEGTGALREIMPMLLGLSIITASFFGQGMGLVVQRERGMLRRYRLTPLGAGGLLAGNVMAGMALLCLTVCLQLALLHLVYKAPMDFRAAPFIVVALVGAVAMASLGLVIAAVASTMQEAQILMQLAFMSTVFLSGMTIPLDILPPWVQSLAQFLPPTHMMTPLRGVLFKTFTWSGDGIALLALVLMTVCAFTIATRLFRWEKNDPLPRRAKASALLALIPVLLFGAWKVSQRPATHPEQPGAVKTQKQ